MGTLRKFLAVVLGLIALALLTHSVVGELYGVYLDRVMAEPHVIWDYLNWFLALGVVVMVIYHFRQKRALDRRNRDENVTLEYLWTNLLLFTSLFLALWFFANWFEELNLNETTSRTVMGFIWLVFNGAFVALGAVTAWQLWQGDVGADSASAASLERGEANPMPPAGAATES